MGDVGTRNFDGGWWVWVGVEGCESGLKLFKMNVVDTVISISS